MTTIEQCRRLLGEEFGHLTDEEVAELLQGLRVLASIGIEADLNTRNKIEKNA